MTEFKVGDRVRTTRVLSNQVPAGSHGTVVEIGERGDDGTLSPFGYRVDFTGQDFFGRDKPWPVMEFEIEKVSEQYEDTVTIKRIDYDRMVTQVKWLSALEDAGVDNWEGYAVAQDIFQKGS